MSQSTSANLINPRMVFDVWPAAKKLLDPAIDISGGRLTSTSVLDSLISGDMQLWLAVDERLIGALVTQVSTYPSGIRILSVLLMGGIDMEKWLPLWEEIELWAGSIGCVGAEIPRGRKGWSRTLKGWNEMVFMEKAI